ncbi:hypothetical protein [Streptomyces misionensis]|uniref:hypothetical protein n=1 Tax=Streptomyces misionensis TaxID=67331 RepID=UPI0033B39013
MVDDLEKRFFAASNLLFRGLCSFRQFDVRQFRAEGQEPDEGVSPDAATPLILVRGGGSSNGVHGCSVRRVGFNERGMPGRLCRVQGRLELHAADGDRGWDAHEGHGRG